MKLTAKKARVLSSIDFRYNSTFNRQQPLTLRLSSQTKQFSVIRSKLMSIIGHTIFSDDRVGRDGIKQHTLAAIWRGALVATCVTSQKWRTCMSESFQRKQFLCTLFYLLTYTAVNNYHGWILDRLCLMCVLFGFRSRSIFNFVLSTV